MNFARGCFIACYWSIGICCAPILAVAQQDPFAPQAAPPATAPAGANQDTEGDQGATQDDPTVNAVIASNPQTPAEIMRAVEILLDIDRDDLAKTYLERLSAQQLSDQQWFELYRAAGPDAVFRISHRADLQPVGEAAAAKIYAGAERHATDDSRIQQLLSTITDEDQYVRSEALANLRLLGDVGAAALINLLADEAYRADWPRIRAAIRYFGNAAEEPLLAALRSKHAKLRAEAIKGLGHVPTSASVEALYVFSLSPQSAPIMRQVANQSLKRLTGRVPDLGEVELRLHQSARDYLMDEVVINQDLMDQVKWWQWDESTQSLKLTWLPAQTVSRIRAFHRARDLLHLQPDRDDFSRLYWLTRLESAKLVGGIDKPLLDSVLQQFSASAPPDLVLAVLGEALQIQRIPAAVAALEVLALQGSSGLLATMPDAPSPLLDALDAGDVRVSHAAVRAISSIDPKRSFAGSSRYIDALARLARCSGQRKALIGHVNRELAQTLGGMVAQAGFFPVVSTRSSEIFDRISSDPDIELLVLTDAVDRPDFAELVQSIRANGSSSDVPIVLMVGPENMVRAERLARRLANISVALMALDPSIIARQVDTTLQQLPLRQTSGEERLNFAKEALARLVQMAEHPDRYPYYELLNHQEIAAFAVSTPGLAPDACRLLSHIGTSSAQLNLLGVAGNDQLPESLRRLAAASFASAIENRGIMLTRDQILNQYGLYNASADSSTETQQILGSILDAIEKQAD